MNALTMRMLGKNVFVVSICAACLVASPAPAQAPHPPGSSLSPLLRVKHQNMRIDRALANGRIDKKMADEAIILADKLFVICTEMQKDLVS